MTIGLRWKVAAALAALVLAALAWNGVSRYLAARHADELIQESRRAAALQAEQAKARARQRHDQLARDLRQRREELASNYRQVADQAREYQARRVVQLERQQEQDRRVAASYLLDENQQCANGIVIDRRGSTFTQARGRGGGPIRCQGDKALEPLR
ncbi:hypothetical protein [Rhodanobacter lindaniclasticus]|uniref:Uncharacterized protein n=1 Tax=Rhodanobacter lindaniclasticus TaxID=75310 RepID=A0A4S3KL89_9GAMM|nr:hypothetical protein [Rhodanobacter lindaniclasticus]THD09470.1 hypothetical protein B1991_02430 [Rhodanobacter lindaniclasticus]